METNFVQYSKILKEIIFVTIKSKHFKDADHFVVTILNQAMKEWDGRILDHTEHCVFPQNFMLVLHDALNIIVILRIFIILRANS